MGLGRSTTVPEAGVMGSWAVGGDFSLPHLLPRPAFLASHLCVPPNACFSRLGCSHLGLSLASRPVCGPRCALVTLPSSSTPRGLTSRSCNYLTAPLSFQSPGPVKYLLNGWHADFQLLLWYISTNSQLTQSKCTLLRFCRSEA